MLLLLYGYRTYFFEHNYYYYYCHYYYYYYCHYYYYYCYFSVIFD